MTTLSGPTRPVKSKKTASSGSSPTCRAAATCSSASRSAPPAPPSSGTTTSRPSPATSAAPFRWEKFSVEGGETYHVCLDGDRATCECKGHLAHGHRTVCKHVTCTRKLIEQGKL
jgi:hypothetical protein